MMQQDQLICFLRLHINVGKIIALEYVISDFDAPNQILIQVFIPDFRKITKHCYHNLYFFFTNVFFSPKGDFF